MITETDLKCEAGLVYEREASAWSRLGEKAVCSIMQPVRLERPALRGNHSNFDLITNVFYK